MNALDVLSRLRIESGQLWTEVATDWQLADLRAVLDGPEPFSFLTRPRGGSKTTDAAAASLAMLLAADQPLRFYAAASDRDQARLLLDAIEGFAHRTATIAAGLTIDRWKVTAIRSGATLEALAADTSSSWGLRPSGVILDEIGWWPDLPSARTLVDSLLSSAAKTEGCRVAVITSPSSPSHFAHKLRDHAASDPLWRLSETPGPIGWIAPERIEEQRRRLSEPMFRRLFLGEWSEGDEALVADEALRAAVRHEGPLDPEPGVAYTIGVDLGLKRDRSAAAVCHAENEEVILDRVAVWQGSRLRPVRLAVVEDWLADAAGRFNGAELVFDPWQASGLMQRLQGRGVRCSEFTFSAQSVGRLAASLFHLLRDERLALPDDEALLDELAHVQLRETSPGVFRIDHEAGRHDDQAIALALAAHRLQAKPRHPNPVSIRADERPGLTRREEREDDRWQRFLDEGKGHPGDPSFTRGLMERDL